MSQTKAGRRFAKPARQDLSTLRASRNVLVDSQSDCEDPPRSSVTLLGCGLVISSVTPISDWLRAFDRGLVRS